MSFSEIVGQYMEPRAGGTPWNHWVGLREFSGQWVVSYQESVGPPWPQVKMPGLWAPVESPVEGGILWGCWQASGSAARW